MAMRLSAAVRVAVQTALHALVAPQAAHLVEAALLLFDAGEAAALRSLLGTLPLDTSAAAIDRATVIDALVGVAAFQRSIDQTADRATELQRAHALFDLANALRTLPEGYSAYLLCEVAYGLTEKAGTPAVEIAELQLALASPANAREWHGCAWRCAIERCRDALAHKAGWLEAIDAFELAMNLEVPDQNLQAALLGKLHAVLDPANGSRIEALKPALVFQAPIGLVNPKTLGQLATSFLKGRGEVDLPGDNDPETLAALRAMAAASIQLHIDDVRLALAKAPGFLPEISWSDHTLRHVQLVDAVPLQKSLIVDLDRSAGTLLELVHEVTHAYSLLGPLGWARTAYRAASQYLEMLLIDAEGARPLANQDEMRATPPLARVAAATPLARVLCDAQFAALLRSKTLQAVWMPWLEGLAVYVELLCDPRDDPLQIPTPHQAVRSLIDHRAERRPGESDAALQRRSEEELVERFESFCSKALKRTSRFRHIGYFRADRLPEVYALGYLVVRSVVAAWERALGERIAPVVAARLLLDATRNGTWAAVPPLDTAVETHEAACHAGLQAFVASLGALPAALLRAYFVPVEADQPGRAHAWVGGRPEPIDRHDIAAMQATPLTQTHAAMREAAVAVALRGGPVLRDFISEADFAAAAATHREPITGLFDLLHSQSSLLAVGRCQARVIVLDEAEARVAICPRTFAGLHAGTAVDDLAVPRYSTRFLTLAGGAAELQQLRAAFRTRRSARVLCTRVLDMVGLDETPYKAQNTSYMYFGLGDWRFVSAGDSMRPIGAEFKRFSNLLHLRIEPPALMRDEASTLDAADFLLQRIDPTVPRPQSAERLAALSVEGLARTSAVALAARAFAAPEAEIAAAVDTLVADRAEHGALADYLYGTDDLLKIARAAATPIGRLAFDPEALSGIRSHHPGEPP